MFGSFGGEVVFTVSISLPFSFSLLSSASTLTVPQASLQVITEDDCQLWWAAKEMQRGKKLQDYIGKNEKTKLVVKIQKVRAIFAKVEQVYLWHKTGCVLVVLCFCFALTTIQLLSISSERAGGASERGFDH